MPASGVQLINNQNNNQKVNGLSPTAGVVSAPPGAGQASSQPGSSTAGSTNNGGTSGSGNSTGQSGPPKTGTGFTNLQALIGANQGNNLAQTVGSGINQTVQNTQNDLNQSQQQFNTDTSANSTAGNEQQAQGIIGQILGYSGNNTGSGNPYQSSGVNTVGSGTPTTSSSTAPTSTTPSLAANLSQQQVNQFQNMLSGNYNGPSQLENYGQLSSEANQAQGLSSDINSSGGLQSLLQQYIGGNNNGGGYTQGQQTLDQLLLGQGNTQGLQQAGQQAGQLTNQIQNANAAAQAQNTQQQSLAQQQAQAINSDLTNASLGITNAAQTAANTANTNDTNNAALQQDYNTWIAGLTAPPSTTPTQINGGTGPVGAATPGATTNSASTAALQALISGGQLTQDQANQIQQLVSQGYQNTGGMQSTQLQDLQNNISTLTSDQQQAQQQLAALQASIANGTSTDPQSDNTISALQQQIAQDQNNLNVSNQQLSPLQQATATPQYNSLASLLGPNQTPTQWLQSGLQFNAPTTPAAYTSFINPSQAAQLNALSQLQGNGVNPITGNLTTYTPGTFTNNVGNNLASLLGQEQSANAAEQAQNQAIINGYIQQAAALDQGYRNAPSGLTAAQQTFAPGSLQSIIGNAANVNPVSIALNPVTGQVSGLLKGALPNLNNGTSTSGATGAVLGGGLTAVGPGVI